MPQDAPRVPAADPPADVRADHGMAPRLTHLAIAVGLVLVAVGFALVFLERAPVLSSLTICVGFGLVLVAFGARAQGQWRGWSATGAGAMAILLFLVLMYFDPGHAPDFKKRGQLKGDLSKVAHLQVVDETPLYQYRDATTGALRFIVLDKKFKNRRLTIQVDTVEKGQDADGQSLEYFELVADGEMIEREYLTGHPREVVEWIFDYKRRLVRDDKRVIFKVPDDIDETLLETNLRGQRDGTRSGALQLIASAYAQDATDPAARAETLLRELEADDASVRRNARDGLAALGPDVVAPMAARLRQPNASYRLRLGIVHALAEMLRRDPGEREAVSKQLSENDLRLLVAAAGDEDRTLRLHATELLYILQDKRAVAPSLEAVRRGDNPNGVYNNVLILKRAAPTLPEPEQRRLREDVSRAIPAQNERTRALLDKW